MVVGSKHLPIELEPFQTSGQVSLIIRDKTTARRNPKLSLESSGSFRLAFAAPPLSELPTMTRLESPSSRFALLAFFPGLDFNQPLFTTDSFLINTSVLFITQDRLYLLKTLSCILIGLGFKPKTFKSKQVVLSLLYKHSSHSRNHENSGLALKEERFCEIQAYPYFH